MRLAGIRSAGARPRFGALVLAVLATLVGGTITLGVLAGGGGRSYRQSSDYALDLPTAPTD